MSGDIIKIYLYIQIAVLLTDPRLVVSTGHEWRDGKGGGGKETRIEWMRMSSNNIQTHKAAQNVKSLV